MPDTAIFIGVAQQYGFGAEAAQEALNRIRAQLQHHAGERFYLYRTGGGGVGAGSPEAPPPRTRTLLAFRSADAALAFAQHYGLGAAPRLLTLSLPQLLAVLVQRPTINALLITTDQEQGATNGLPDGLRIERETLLAQLAHTERSQW
jgi:hypothetical protein